MPNIVELLPLEMTLKRQIRRHLKELGFVKDEMGNLVPPNLTKETYRGMHCQHRLQKLEKNEKFLAAFSSQLIQFIASGDEVIPDKISPRIEVVKSDSWQSNLFRFATLFWQVPVSEGYGRRMRFLVWDDYNDKLIGIFALGDAVFNLRVRDELIGWDHKQRAEKLVNIMDAYVLGALPPYNTLLGGKLIACLVKSQEVKEAFRKKYGKSTGIISGKAKAAKLTLITTTSSLGRSSIYNRLKIEGDQFFEPIGFTSGFGHFHIPDDLFNKMRVYLTEKGDKYSQNFCFGEGPNWRFRAIRKVFKLLGLPDSLINHGLPREVFMAKVASNAFEILLGNKKRADYAGLSTVENIGERALNRWVIPRSIRNHEYLLWRSEHFLDSLSHADNQSLPLYALRKN